MAAAFHGSPLFWRVGSCRFTWLGGVGGVIFCKKNEVKIGLEEE